MSSPLLVSHTTCGVGSPVTEQVKVEVVPELKVKVDGEALAEGGTAYIHRHT